MKRHPIVLSMLPLALACATALAQSPDAKIDSHLKRALTAAPTAEALVQLAPRADPLLLDPNAEYRVHRRAWVTMLQATAHDAQADLVGWLQARGIEHQAFWIADAIWVRADAATIAAIAARSDVVRVDANPLVHNALPRPEPAGNAPNAIDTVEWGVNKINAPLVWALGFTGQGVVIAGEDTGYQWDHPAIQPHYRGWDGSTADHNYNWHDSIHDAVGNPCGNDSPFPCDDVDHGTHTMGTMTGDDGGGNQIGVAPGAKWIGCRNMDQGNGTPARYIECMEWMLAPTDLNNQNPNPDLAPAIISNSWTCPTSEGCTTGQELVDAVNSVVAGGIFFAAAAANAGPNCDTITDPPAIYDSSYTVGSTTSSDAMSSFSSRGPVAGDTHSKPEASAPGSSVRSSIPVNSYAVFSGTSMATPHVAGTAALLISAKPALQGHPDQIAALIDATAVHLNNTQSCGGIPGTQVPNPVQGYGRIDAFAAVSLALVPADRIFADGFEP